MKRLDDVARRAGYFKGQFEYQAARAQRGKPKGFAPFTFWHPPFSAESVPNFGLARSVELIPAIPLCQMPRRIAHAFPAIS